MLYTWQDIAALAWQNRLVANMVWYALLHHSTTFGDMHACLAQGFVVAVASKHRSHWQQRRHEVPSSSYPFSCPREWLPSSLPKHDMNVTCTKKNFDTILIHIYQTHQMLVSKCWHIVDSQQSGFGSGEQNWRQAAVAGNMSNLLAQHSWAVTLPALNTMSYSGTSLARVS